MVASVLVVRIPPVIYVLAVTFAAAPIALGYAGPATAPWAVVFCVMVWGWVPAWGILIAVSGISMSFALLGLLDPTPTPTPMHVVAAVFAVVSFALFLSRPVQTFAAERQAARRGVPVRPL